MIPYTNRELSWLEFNQRVLDESKREDLPLLERVKFLAISGSNLDEFYQVRIGGLTEQLRKENYQTDPSGMTLSSQLYETRKRAQEMMCEQYKIWNEALFPKLLDAEIKITKPAELSGKSQQELQDRMINNILPVLTPIAIQYEESYLSIPALQLCIICKLKEELGTFRHVFIPVPANLPRLLTLSEKLGESYKLLLEDVIAHHTGELFPHEEVVESSVFRLTKNSDIVLDDEDARDLAGEMKEVLTRRRFGRAVRLEIPEGTSSSLKEIITQITGAKLDHIIDVDGPLGIADLFSLAIIPGFEKYKFEPWHPQVSPTFDPDESIFATLDKKNITLFHPYESFDPVVQLIQEAAEDPHTLAIKQVLYRTASKSHIIEALKKAAMNGKQVTVLIELKARFDEQRNLLRADELQKAGVQVIYGVKGYKTHAKATLVVRKTHLGIKRYVHLGTGNYNESTANLYTDISYLTSQTELGSDTSLFFNMLTGHSKMTRFSKLRPAPTHMKSLLIELIGKEAKIAKSGQKARILAKMNSLQDPDIIAALYSASQAGVEIKLNIRGICCLKPDIKGVSDNIEVVSIIDRYLEHTRTFYFEQAGDQQVYISSADWMVRNLEKRLELMIPIEEDRDKERIKAYLLACFKDNTNAHIILPDGSSERISSEGKVPFRFQEYMYKLTKERITAKNETANVTFQPHSSPEL